MIYKTTRYIKGAPARQAAGMQRAARALGAPTGPSPAPRRPAVSLLRPFSRHRCERFSSSHNVVLTCTSSFSIREMAIPCAMGSIASLNSGRSHGCLSDRSEWKSGWKAALLLVSRAGKENSSSDFFSLACPDPVGWSKPTSHLLMEA